MCLLLLFPGSVGPWWVHVGPSSRSVEPSFGSSNMLKARLAPGWRYPGPRVVRAGWGHTLSSACSRVPDGQAVISASTGALRLRTLPPPGGLLPAFSTSRAAAAAAFRPSSIATLRYVSAVSTTLEWPS
jgi:hypothetical protein